MGIEPGLGDGLNVGTQRQSKLKNGIFSFGPVHWESGATSEEEQTGGVSCWTCEV